MHWIHSVLLFKGESPPQPSLYNDYGGLHWPVLCKGSLLQFFFYSLIDLWSYGHFFIFVIFSLLNFRTSINSDQNVELNTVCTLPACVPFSLNMILWKRDTNLKHTKVNFSVWFLPATPEYLCIVTMGTVHVIGHEAGNSLFSFLTHSPLIAPIEVNYIHRTIIIAICYYY